MFFIFVSISMYFSLHLVFTFTCNHYHYKKNGKVMYLLCNYFKNWRQNEPTWYFSRRYLAKNLTVKDVTAGATLKAHGCNIPMWDQPRRDVSDQYSWWYLQCKTRTSIRDESFFQKPRIILQQLMLFSF